MDKNTVSYHYEDETFNVNLFSGNVILNEDTEIQNHYISLGIFGIFILYFLFSIVIIHCKSFYFLYKLFNKYINLNYLGIYSLGNIIFIGLYILTWAGFLIYSYIISKRGIRINN